jgi:hypothetical protein
LTNRRVAPMVLVILALLMAAVLLTACTIVLPDDLSYEGGQIARDYFDRLMDQVGQFIAGFCSASALPIAALGAITVLLPRLRQQ